MNNLLRRFSYLLIVIASLFGVYFSSVFVERPLVPLADSEQPTEVAEVQIHEHLSPTSKRKKTPEERTQFVLERLQYEFDMQKDPVTGKIPDRIKELELAQAYRAPKLSNHTRGAGVTAEPRGPNNLGGRSRTICFDVRNPQIILAGGVSSGVFKTTNGGASWTKVSSNAVIHNVSAIVQDTRAGQEDTWYYATGEAIGNSASLGALYFGQGIWKSTDNGDNWTLLGNSNSGSLESFDSRADFITRLAVDPTNGNVYAAALGQILRSTDGGANWTSVLDDGGFSWSTSWVTDLVITPTGRLYAAFSGFNPSGMDGIWTSTTGASASWTRIAASGVGATPASWHTNGNYGRIVLGLAPSNELVLFALYYNRETADCTPVTMEADLFRLEFDGVSTWAFTDLSGDLPAEDCGDLLEHAGNDPFAVQGGYDLCISVKPDDEDVFFVGGTNAYRMDYAAGSATFSRIGGYLNHSTYAQTANHHSDIHTFAFKPGDPDTLFTGTDGGLQKTEIATIAWISLNNDYVTYQDYHVAISPTMGSDLIIGGSQDNGTHESTSGTSHSQILSGDGVACGISSAGHYYMGTQRGNIYRDLAGAGGFSFIKPTGAGNGIFVTYFYLDPDNTEYLYYANDDDLYRTSTATTVTSGTWTLMTGIGATLTGDIRSMATSRGSGYAATDATRKLYIGTSDGLVYVLTDPAFTGAASVPTNITPPGAGSGIVSGIAVNPNDDDEVLITYSNYSTTNVFHTTNGGTSWTDVEGNLTLPSFRSSAIMYNGGNVFYFVGTSVGLYCSQVMNGGSTVWSQVDQSDIGHAIVSSLRLRTSDDFMAVGTHGNGNFMVEPPRDPEILFDVSTSAATESSVSSSSCRNYQVLTVDMRILAAPTGDATVTLALAGTAQEGIDYDIINTGNAVTFPDGMTANQTFTIWVYDDTDPESDETAILTYSISGTTDATAASFNQTHTLTISDNDESPLTIPNTIWTEDWDGTITGWTWDFLPAVAPVNRWLFTSSCSPISGISAQIIEDTGGGLFCDYGHTTASTAELYKSVDATGYTNIVVNFDYICVGEGTVGSPIDYGSVVYSTDGGSTWIPVGDPLVGVSTSTSTSVTLPAVLDGTIFLLGWQWINNGSGGNDPPMSLDNIVVTGGLPADVESDLTAGSIDEYLGPFETAYFYDGSELMCKIENTSSHNFGCTTVAIDRSGSSTVDFWHSGVANNPKDLASKTYFVTPTTNSGTATYDITLYYTATEVSGWEAVTGKTFTSEVQMVKNPGAISNVSPGTHYPDGTISIDSVTVSAVNFGTGTSIAVEASFNNGFSGFGVGDPGPPPASLPVEWLDFQAIAEESIVDLEWIVAQEVNLMHYEVERSEDGQVFTKLGKVAAVGSSDSPVPYSFQDLSPITGLNFYRIRQIDVDGSYSYSSIANVWIGPKAILSVTPTLFEDQLSIRASFEERHPSEFVFRLYQLNGKKVLEQRWQHEGDIDQRVLTPSSIASGIYLYDIENRGQRFIGKLIKR
ncbi:MAG: hypothetical protein AAF587_03725 [Bacteroidota bacterium]